MKLIGMIADHPTPKISEKGSAYTLESRDHKGVMVVVLSKDNGTADGKDVGRLLRSGCIHGYVYNR